MRTRRLGLVGLFLGLWILACSGLPDLADLEAALEPVPPPTEAWAGVWAGPGHTLIIAPDGTVQLQKQEGHTTQNVTAPAKGWEGGVTIGIGPITQTWVIEQPPHEVDGEWRMVFDGEVLVRKGPPPPGFGRQSLGLDDPGAFAVPVEPSPAEPAVDDDTEIEPAGE